MKPFFRRQLLATSAGLAGAWACGGRAAGVSRSAAVSRSAGVLKFPPGFLFGVGTSAYQVEGSPRADGKGESIWDRWTHIPGKTALTGDVAVDHYRRFKDDLPLLKQLGVNTYRFSIAWTRVLPDGTGAPNEKGIAFYQDMVKRLRAANIKPAVTLFHWDTPQKLQDQGGWANRKMVDWFEAYAALVVERLGEDVDLYTTFNEPWVTCYAGHYYGNHPPGLTDFSTAWLCNHHINLAHGRAVKVIRARNPKAQVGITLDLMFAYPASEKLEDVAAAKRENEFHMGFFGDPIFLKRYPSELVAFFEQRGAVKPQMAADDFETIAQPIDFLGVNYYHGVFKKNSPANHWPLEHKEIPTPHAKTARHPIDGQGLYDLLLWVKGRYNTPVIITENGKNLPDEPDDKGQVNDDRRIEYLYKHLAACRRALDSGVDVRGYIVWTWLDNFEWGTWSRMGLVWSDFETQRRIIKKSGRWFAQGVHRGFAAP